MRAKISTRSMVGRRYGKLTVVGLAHKNERSMWYVECVCDCGTRCIKMAKNLNYKYTQSCGCLLYASQRQEHKEVRRPPREIAK